MKPETNPITESLKYLVDSGWTELEARHLMRAINDKDGKRLFFEVAPKWVAHCGERMSYVKNMLGLVAQGLVSVSLAEDGEWMFALNEKGIEAGKEMGLK